MFVLHVSVECYPVAKVGGLADVVGALPKYECLAGLDARVVIPYYDKDFVHKHGFEQDFSGSIVMDGVHLPFTVLKETDNVLGFPLYLIRVPGVLDRKEVYGYSDDYYQFMAFQQAVLKWLTGKGMVPDVVHCHDHHTGFIPFLMQHGTDFGMLNGVVSIGTVHNAQYQGQMEWDKARFLPSFDRWKWGMLDWNNKMNSLAALIKGAWAYTTVSPGYLSEIFNDSAGLESLFRMESEKGYGIVNGIDDDVWDPRTDNMIHAHYGAADAGLGKWYNKEEVCRRFGLDPQKPLVAFIGRFAYEKGADLLEAIIGKVLHFHQNEVNVIVLGSGDATIEGRMRFLQQLYPDNFNGYIGYNESISHQLYAAADFLLMPSRVEPCGLNQLYALRYGTMPVVSYTGGLKDTVVDVSDKNGYGLVFDKGNVDAAVHAVARGIALYQNHDILTLFRERMMHLDFSWGASTQKYIHLYQSFK